MVWASPQTKRTVSMVKTLIYKNFPHYALLSTRTVPSSTSPVEKHLTKQSHQVEGCPGGQGPLPLDGADGGVGGRAGNKAGAEHGGGVEEWPGDSGHRDANAGTASKTGEVGEIRLCFPTFCCTFVSFVLYLYVCLLACLPAWLPGGGGGGESVSK